MYTLLYTLLTTAGVALIIWGIADAKLRAFVVLGTIVAVFGMLGIYHEAQSERAEQRCIQLERDIGRATRYDTNGCSVKYQKRWIPQSEWERIGK